MRLSLLHKGLLLVSIPLCFELVVFGLLLKLQNEMAQESARINQARLISDAVNKSAKRMVVIYELVDSMNNPFALVRSVRAGIQDILTQLAILDKLTVNDSSGHARVVFCEQEATQALTDFEELKKFLMSRNLENIPEAAKKFRPKFNAHMKNIVTSGFLELGADNVGDINVDRTTAMREQVVFLLKFAVALSALIGLLGASVYSRHLISRLNIVLANAIKLGERKELIKPISGRDEISELDAALHEAESLISRLEQAREEVVAMVSHDIRSPLATIRYSSEALQDELADSIGDHGKSLLAAIDNNCDRILRISKDLLDMQRLEAGLLVIDREPTSLKDCLISAAATVDGMCQNRGIAIQVELDDVMANVDSGRIEQIVTNLLTNAIKYSPRKGVVKLGLRKTEIGRWAQISVIDGGVGVPDHLKAIIFDRFRQVDNADLRQGSGVGLAIVKALVELHNGTIGINDVQPQGSEFWVKLPL